MSAVVQFGCGHVAADPWHLARPDVSDCPECFEAFGKTLTPAPLEMVMHEKSTGRAIIHRIPRRLGGPRL